MKWCCAYCRCAATPRASSTVLAGDWRSADVGCGLRQCFGCAATTARSLWIGIHAAIWHGIGRAAALRRWRRRLPIRATTCGPCSEQQHGEGFWAAWPRRDPQAIIVQFGFHAVINEVVLVPRSRGEQEHPVGCAPALVEYAGEADGSGYRLVEGHWPRLDSGAQSLRFSPVVAAAIRITLPPETCGAEGGAESHSSSARENGHRGPLSQWSGAGTGRAPMVAARGRRPTDLATRRVVQGQLELWSDYAAHGPVLRAAEVAHMRYQSTRAEEERCGNG